MAEPQEDWELKWELLIADAWDDEELKQRLLSDPMGLCAERGIKPPEGVRINVVEDTDDTVNLVLPQPPQEEELSEEELESVAGGHHSLCIQICGGCGGMPACGCGGCGCGRGCSRPRGCSRGGGGRGCRGGRGGGGGGRGCRP